MGKRERSRVEEATSPVVEHDVAERVPDQTEAEVEALLSALRGAPSLWLTRKTLQQLLALVGIGLAGCARAGWLMDYRAGWLMGIARARRVIRGDGHRRGARVVPLGDGHRSTARERDDLDGHQQGHRRGLP